MIRAVSHLIDDASFGGINRMLDHMASSADLQQTYQHRITRVERGQLSAPDISADVIVSHLSINWANLPLLTALRAGHPDTPIIHVEHSYSQRFVAARVQRRDRFEALLRIAFSLFDTIVAVSDAQFRWMQRREFCPVEKLVAIPSFVDLEPFFKVADRSGGDRFAIGAIGRFDVQKGFDVLLEAFVQADRSDLDLHLFGDGPQAETLREIAQLHPGITLHGYTADTSQAVAMCDAIAIPSRWEPYGLVALEAMAAGRAVLCPRVDGLGDHIGAGAIEIGDNSREGWAAFLGALEADGFAARNENLRHAARNSAARAANSWITLLDAMCDTQHDLARAA